MDSSQWADLPLFPLNTVLFPGMVLPLRIFEDRYKLMISYCLEEERPFGVLLIREGTEVGGPAVPYRVGTTTVIAGVSRLEDGEMNIITIGSERFRLRSLRRDQAYLVGDAEPWPLLSGSTEQAEVLVGPIRALFRQYLDLLTQAEGHKITIEEVPTDPRTLALTLAIALQLRMPEKQRLLMQPTVSQMLLVERAIMKREQLLLGHVVQTQMKQWEGGYSGYLAKN